MLKWVNFSDFLTLLIRDNPSLCLRWKKNTWTCEGNVGLLYFRDLQYLLRYQILTYEWTYKLNVNEKGQTINKASADRNKIKEKLQCCYSIFISQMNSNLHDTCAHTHTHCSAHIACDSCTFPWKKATYDKIKLLKAKREPFGPFFSHPDELVHTRFHNDYISNPNHEWERRKSQFLIQIWNGVEKIFIAYSLDFSSGNSNSLKNGRQQRIEKDTGRERENERSTCNGWAQSSFHLRSIYVSRSNEETKE